MTRAVHANQPAQVWEAAMTAGVEISPATAATAISGTEPR